MAMKRNLKKQLEQQRRDDQLKINMSIRVLELLTNQKMEVVCQN